MLDTSRLRTRSFREETADRELYEHDDTGLALKLSPQGRVKV